MQEKLESHWLGRGVISSGIILVLIAMVLPNLPAGSRIGGGQGDNVRPLTDITGLHEGWGMFGTVDKAGTLHMSARIIYADGTSERWRFPDEGKLLTTYRSYRWRQFGYEIWGDGTLQPGFAQWLADAHRRPGKEPVEVQLLSRFASTPPPGSDAPRRWTTTVVYRHSVPPTDGGAA